MPRIPDDQLERLKQDVSVQCDNQGQTAKQCGSVVNIRPTISPGK
jgi:hypothetical protein